MKLNKTEIPKQLLLNLPEGLKIVNRHGHEFLVVDDIRGPKGESLISRDVRIHGEPTIRFGIKIGNSEGLIFVDSYWGSHAKLYSFLPDISDPEKMVEAFTPENKTSLMTERKCNVEGCGSEKSITLHLPGGKNKIHVCARLGCPGHKLEVEDLPKKVSDAASNINFFGEGGFDDDWFDEMYRISTRRSGAL